MLICKHERLAYNSLIIHGDRLNIQREMFLIISNGSALITSTLFDESFA